MEHYKNTRLDLELSVDAVNVESPDVHTGGDKPCPYNTRP
jgi:hypothetical protein